MPLSATQLSRMSDDLLAADIVLLERAIHQPDAWSLSANEQLRYSQLVQERHVRAMNLGREQARRLLYVEKMLEELAQLAPGGDYRDSGCSLEIDDVVRDEDNLIWQIFATKSSTWLEKREPFILGEV